MSDITTTASSEKMPILGPIKQQKKSTLESKQEEILPYAGSTEPINPEHLEQIKQDLLHHASPQQQSEQLKKHASALKEFSEKDLQQIKQELASLSPKQLKDLVNQLKKNLAQLQATLTELKKQKKVDPETADLILDTIANVNSKDLRNLSKDDQQKLNNTLDALKEKITDLVKNQQIEPKIGNILVLFLAFAKTQMDQNDKAMLAGIQQTKVKTAELELQAEKQKDFAGQSTQGTHVNTTYAIGWSMLGLCLGAIVGAILAPFTAGLSIAAGMALGAAIGGVVGGASVAITAAVASNNPDAPGIGGITEEGPDSTKTSKLQTLLAYCNTEVQKLSSQLGSTQKMFVENVSDRSTQLGQQAGQAITEMGEIMKSR